MTTMSLESIHVQFVFTSFNFTKFPIRDWLTYTHMVSFFSAVTLLFLWVSNIRRNNN